MKFVLAGVVLLAIARLPAQTILTNGATYSSVITGDIALNPSTSATFAVGADFTGANATIGANATLNFNESIGFAGKNVAVGSGPSIGYLQVIGTNNTLTFGSGTNTTGAFEIYSTATGGTIVNQGAIIANSNATSYVYAPTFSNQGTIAATGGGTLYVGYYNGESTTNASGGTITADNGSTVLLHSLVNQGTLTAQNGGLLQFIGSNTTPDLGAVQLLSGGRALLNNTLDNTGHTLSAPTGGVYELYNGTIQNGTVAGGALTYTSSGGTLSGVTLNGNFVEPVNSSVTFTNGTSFTLTNATIANNATLNWNQTGTLTGDTITMGSGPSIGYIQVGGTNNTLTFGSGTNTTGAFEIYSTATGGTIVNQGAITANSNATTYVFAPTFSNQGTIAATGGGSLYVGYYNGEATTNASGGTITADNSSTVLLHSLVNQGTLTAQNSGLLQFTGSNTTPDLGTVQLLSGGRALLNNTLDNTGHTLSAPTGGVYELYAGTILNGTVASGALAYTGSGGTLSGVTLNGNFVEPVNSSVTFTNGTSFTLTNATIANGATLNWNQTGTLTGDTIAMGAGGSIGYIQVGGTSNTLTFGSGTNTTGAFEIYSTATGGTIVNQGAITANSNATTYVFAPTFSNQGTIAATGGGSLYVGYYNGEATTNASGGTITADNSSTVLLHSLVNQGTLTAQNSGLLQFIGSNTTPDLGTVQLLSGGRALLNNTLDNTGHTLTAPTGGVYELYAGTIQNGTVASGALTYTSSGGTLSGVTLNGNFVEPVNSSVTFTNGTSFTLTNATIANGATLNWNQTGTLTGDTIAIGAGGSLGYIQVGATNNTLTFGSGTNTTGAFEIYSSATGGTIVNQGAITANSNATTYLFAPTFSNQGTIAATGGGSLYVGYYNGEATTNASGGTITADNSSTVLLHSLVNQGTLTAQNSGLLQFIGSNTTPDLGTVQLLSGGRALLNNTLDNTGHTLTAPTGGVYELYNGTIQNGTVASGALTYTSSGGTLSGVTLSGNFVEPVNSSVTFTNGTSFTLTNATIANGATLNWNQTGTLTGDTITMGAGGNLGYIQVGGTNNTLTLGSGTNTTGAFEIYSTASGGTIVNQGTITANSNATNYVFAPTLTNQGAITATGGGSLYIGYFNGYAVTNASGGTITADNANVYLHSLVNQGTLTAQNNGALQFQSTNVTADLGTVQLLSGGKAQLAGTLDNTSATLNAPSGGAYDLLGGTIQNGLIAAGALNFTTSGGYLNGTTIAGDLTLPASSAVYFQNGASFTGSNLNLGGSASLRWNQSGTLSGTSITAANGGNIEVIGPNNTLTLAANTTYNGYAGIYSDGSAGIAITNYGTINHTAGSAALYAANWTNLGTINLTTGTNSVGTTAPGYLFTNAAGGTINNSGTAITYLQTPSAAPFLNLGTINAQGGSFQLVNTQFTNGATGTVTGAGILNGNFTLGGGTLAPGNSGVGTLTISNGTFTVTNASTFAIDVSGSSADQVLFQNPTATIDLGSGILALSLNLLSAPTPNATYTIMKVSGGSFGITGTFAGLPNNGDSISANFGGTSYLFNVAYLGNSVVLSVPEPQTYALMATGLLLIGMRHRRRRTGK